MEVDDIFNSDQNYSFGEELQFFEEADNEDVKNLPSYNLEIPIEEIKLAEISPEEMFQDDRIWEESCLKDTTNCFQKGNINSSICDSVKSEISKHLKGPTSKTTNLSECNLVSNTNSLDVISSTNSKFSSLNEENSTLLKCDDLLSLEKFFDSHEMNCFEYDKNEEPSKNLRDCGKDTFLFENEFDLQKPSSVLFEVNKDECLGYSFTNVLISPDKPKEIKVASDQSVFADHSISNEENHASLIENSSLLGNKLNPLISKLSNLQFPQKISSGLETKNLPFLPKVDNSQNIQSYTATRKELKPSHNVKCAKNHNSVKKEKEPPSKVPDLFKFMNIRKLPLKHLDYSPSQSLLTDPKTHNQMKDYAQDNTSYRREDTMHKSPILNEVYQDLFLADVTDIFVQLPDVFVDVVLMYEAVAIPFLQSLISFEKFNFPSNLTLANIPSYKTCFLLNQEAKECQDNILKKDDKEFYRNLLCLHGIIKSLEIFFGFDSQLAISALQDFQNSHESLIKGQYKNLIRKLTPVINNMCDTYSIHPKVKELCNFIKEKSKYYKENDLEFKVLLILRKQMDLFYYSFEAALRNTSIEMKLKLIPESVALHSSTLLFKGAENTVYVINSSSLSKHIPWKSFKLVIEYEYEYDRSHWEQVCALQKIPHIFVKVSDLPLKTLEEIRKLPLKENNKRQEKYLILSSYVASQYQLLYILETKLNASICIRQYKELLPHLHFADVVIDENSAVILVSEVSFYNEDFSSALYDRIAFLYLKYEACWIIIQEQDKNVKIQDTRQQSTKNTFWNFFLNCKKFSETSENFKIKILHAHSIEETVDLINSISAFGARAKVNVIEEPKLSVPKQVSQDELFLLSFPCLNPYVVHLILSEYSLGTFISSDFDKCSKTLHTVPGRFLKCFYSTINKCVASASNQTETMLRQFQNSSPEPSEYNECLDNFELVPSLVKSTEDFPLHSVFPKRCSFSGTVDKSIDELLETGSQNSWKSSSSATTIRKPDLTLEQIDLDYMTLKLGDKYDRYSPSENSCVNSTISSHSTNSFTLSPKEDIGGRSSQVLPDPTDDVTPNAHSSFFDPEELNRRTMVSPLSEIPELGLSSGIFQINNVLDSEMASSSKKNLYFDPKPYFFTPNKRKYSSDSTESSSDSPSTRSKRSRRIQKGVSSKTVTKQDFMYSAPSLNNREGVQFSTDVRRDLPSWPVVKRSNADVSNYFHRRTEKLRKESDCFGSSPISSQNYVSSPMSQSSMLGLVKVPGNGGQTKLRFM